jgi:S-adenosylmethionine-dependent methyltransferase
VTRLESAIRRLSAQRDLLDWAARDVGSRKGIVVELGLGNGRTYDHLRKRLPGHRIIVFERSVAAHPDCIPPSDCLVLGDIRETLPAFVADGHAGTAVLIHADIGTGDTAASDALAAALSPAIEALLSPGGLLVADRAYRLPDCEDISGETGVPQGRYFVYRRK